MTEPTTPIATDDELRDWLLQRLPDSRRELLEGLLVGNTDFSVRLLDVEHGLIDAHARGELDVDDRHAVERYLIADPSGRRRAVVAHAIASMAAESTAKETDAAAMSVHPIAARANARPTGVRRRQVQWAGLAAVAMIVLVIGFKQLPLRPVTTPTAPIELADDDDATLPTVTLLADARRGAREETLTLPAAASRLRLQVEVVDDNVAVTYSLRISDASKTLQEVSDLTVREQGPYRYVETTVAAANLGPGLRRIALRASGTADVTTTTWVVTTQTADEASGKHQ